MAKHLEKLRQLEATGPWDWPASTRDTLHRALTDAGASAEERGLAATLAGDTTVVDDELARLLLAIARAQAESTETRRDAAIALGPALELTDLDPEDDLLSEDTCVALKQGLRSLFEDEAVPRDVRRAALEAAVRAQQEWHVPAVRGAFADADGAWRRTALFCAAYVRGFDAEVMTALTDADPDVKRLAVDAAGAWGLEDAWEHIRPLLSERAPRPLLLAAIAAAAETGHDDATGHLARLADSRDEEIAEAANEALALADLTDALHDA